jgi:hypothetical protein
MSKPKVLDGLEPLLVPIDNLVHLAGNARRGDYKAVAKSLDEFGQHKALVVRKTGEGDNGYPVGEVLIGNHTLMAARSLGWESIAVVWTDEDETTGKARALVDNRASDLGTYDEDALAEMIADVWEGNERLLEATSYSLDDIEKLLGDIQPEEDEEEDEEVTVDNPLKGVERQDDPPARSQHLSLFDRFMVPPFSVLNAREGWWQDRKRSWIDLGIEGELGRDDRPMTWYLAPPSKHHNPDRPMVEMGSAERKRKGEHDVLG